jgi:hypothetical protein
MNKYFISAARFDKTQEDGMIKKVTEQFLVDALSFTECEGKVASEVSPHGEYEIISIKRTNIEELFDVGGLGKFYACKVNYISTDEKTGKEKRFAHNYMVCADGIDAAKKVLESKINMLDYEIVKIAETKILDVIA